MSVLGAVHSLFGLAALGLGTAVVLRPKGTSSHRRLGWAYVASMAGLLSTSFLIYRLFGGFGPFHALAVVGAVTLFGGVLPAWRRRPPEGWLARHYHFMAYSYAGLVAATAAEIAVRLPDAQLGAGAFWGSAAVFAVAVPLIHLNARRMIGRFGGGGGAGPYDRQSNKS
jgi:uncharacterized membrane protein